MRSLRILPAAIEDIAEISAYIEADAGLAVAERFEHLAEVTMQSLRSFPNRGKRFVSSRARMRSVRSWPVDDFLRILVFYRVSRSEVAVMRVLHGARDVPTAIRGA